MLTRSHRGRQTSPRPRCAAIHRLPPRRLSPIASAVLAAIAGHAGAAMAAADTGVDSGQLEEIVVTATKRAENAQEVPSNIDVLSSATLENLGVKDFNDYALLVPSLSFTSTGPGSAQIYFRGLSDGSVNLVETSGVQPTVAVYLDEQPVTNAGRSLDLEIYDIERIEALSGPQGTLFGSSSEAGTVRIITKAPNPAAEDFGTDFSYALSPHGDPSYKVEGYANLPLGDHTAIRLVGWSDQQGGYINNIARSFTFTFPNVPDTVVGGYPTINNSIYAKSNFNSSGKEGLRFSLRTQPSDNWTIDLKFITQKLTSQGVFDVDPALGGDDLNVARFFNDSLDDVFRQYSITANGKIFGDFDLTYAGSYFDRNITYTHDYSMYSDYSEFIAPYYTCQNNGAGVLSACNDPREEFIGTNFIRRWDNELRLQTPLTYPVHAIIGAFNETIEHRYTENYDIPGLNPQSILDSNPYTYLLFDGNRLDRQTAAFTEVTWDITSKLAFLAGVRWYDETNTINGLFQAKPGGSLFELTPHVTATEVGAIKKFNLSYKIQPGVMAYATYSEGYRPNGVNRGTAPADGIGPTYQSDTVKNYEAGLKSQWLDNRLRVNLTGYHMNWNNIQFTTLVPGVVFFVSGNAGKATDNGGEFDISYRPDEHWTLGLNGAYIDAHLTQSFCLGGPCGSSTVIWHAPSGTPLAFVPKEKGSLLARYDFAWSSSVQGHAQLSTSYVGRSWSTMFLETRGPQPSYSLTNLKLGATWGHWASDLFVDNAFDKRAVLFINRSDYDFYQGDQYGRETIARPVTIGLTLSYRH